MQGGVFDEARRGFSVSGVLVDHRVSHIHYCLGEVHPHSRERGLVDNAASVRKANAMGIVQEGDDQTKLE